MTVREAPNFNLIARPYRWMEYLTFGRALQRCRTHFLPQLADCRSALVLGDGDGRFLAAFAAKNQNIIVDAVDSSRSMLRLLTRRLLVVAPGIHLSTHQTSALTFTPNRTYDLVVTHFFLDCLTQPEVETLCTRLVPHLKPNALWLISDFRIPTGPMRWSARILIRALYLAFRLLTGLRTSRLPDYVSALTSAGFERTAQHLSLGGLLTTELWVLPRSRAIRPAGLPQLN